MARKLPGSASVAQSDTASDKLFAPAAARNGPVLCDFLVQHAPPRGTALEIASGTGEHVCAFAVALPGLIWQPTDVDPRRLRSIDAHAASAPRANLLPAVELDATKPGWTRHHPDCDLIVLVNLLHLISADEVQTIFAEAAAALKETGMFVFYGPFSKDGQLTSPGDVAFDAELRSADPAIGYKDTQDIARWLSKAGFNNFTSYPMPSNNLAFIARKVR